ncbi:unnamed protein product [Phytomonas sp. Hart1]|nr:unnamed protein product [Phytomonas sp. Hart1]|eukprot:CCW66411.1 unnamed protein product [Phytomonas sp. isolate Hart1]
MDLDLPPPKPVRIRFCGRPAITTGVVNLQILFGKSNYYLVQQVEESSILLDDTQSLEHIPQNKVPEGDSSCFFVLCSQEGLPTGSFYVEDGKDYWIANGTSHRSKIMQAPTSEVPQEESEIVQKNPNYEGETFHYSENNPTLDYVESEKASIKRSNKKTRLETFESIPFMSKELSGGESLPVEPHTHNHDKKHHDKKRHKHRPDSSIHDVEKADLVDSSSILDQPLWEKLLPELSQSNDKPNNLIENTSHLPSCLAADISEVPKMKEDDAYSSSLHEDHELNLERREEQV